MGDAEWFVPVAIIVGLQLVLTLWLAAVGLAPMPLFGETGLLAYLFMGLVAIVRYLALLVQMWRSGETAPMAPSVAVTKANFGRIVFAALAVQVLGVQTATFSALKAAIPSVNAFWLDAFLMRLDALLFGEQPWNFAHVAFGWATPFFDAAYAAWMPIQIVTIFSVLLLKPSELKGQALISFVLAWLLLGIIAACALSSVGPIFYDRLLGEHAFVGLPLADAPATSRVSAMLWTSYTSGQLRVGGGISAMPSMHVALALWFAFVLHKTFLRPVAWAYVPIVWIASVMLGWHYATDGLVGLLGMLVIWRLSPRILKLASVWRRESSISQAVAN